MQRPVRSSQDGKGRPDLNEKAREIHTRAVRKTAAGLLDELNRARTVFPGTCLRVICEPPESGQDLAKALREC